MAGEKFLTFNNFIAKTWDGTIPMNLLQSRSYKLALFTGASNAADLTVTTFANLTNEISATNGYTAGGFAVSGLNVTSPSAGQFLLRAADVQIQAVGGSLVFRHAVIYDTVSGIVCFTSPVNLVGGTPTDLTVTTNNYFISQLSNGFMLYRANNA